MDTKTLMKQKKIITFQVLWGPGRLADTTQCLIDLFTVMLQH